MKLFIEGSLSRESLLNMKLFAFIVRCCMFLLNWPMRQFSPVYTLTLSFLMCRLNDFLVIFLIWLRVYSVSVYWLFLYLTPVGICVAVELHRRSRAEEQQLAHFLPGAVKDICVVKSVVFATKIRLKIFWDGYVMSEHFFYDCRSWVIRGLKIPRSAS